MCDVPAYNSYEANHSVDRCYCDDSVLRMNLEDSLIRLDVNLNNIWTSTLAS